MVWAVSISLAATLEIDVSFFSSSYLESPDLAITEAAVGAGVTSLLFFVTLKKIHAMKKEGDDDE